MLEGVQFKMALLMHKAKRGTMLPYLSQLVCVASLPGHSSLRSGVLSASAVWQTVCLQRLRGWAFPVVRPTIWNSLTDSVISLSKNFSVYKLIF